MSLSEADKATITADVQRYFANPGALLAYVCAYSRNDWQWGDAAALFALSEINRIKDEGNG